MTYNHNARSAVIYSLILVLAALCSTQAYAQEHFPKPPELEPDVAFWLRVYTEV